MAEVEFTYVNWRGERKNRRVEILGLRFGTTQWYPRPGWLLRGMDLDKKVEREFSLGNMRPLGGTLVVDYDTKQVLLAMTEIAKVGEIIGHVLLEGLKQDGGTQYKLGGAGSMLDKNLKRLDHIAHRLAGDTDKPFEYIPPGGVASDGTVAAVVQTLAADKPETGVAEA